MSKEIDENKEVDDDEALQAQVSDAIDEVTFTQENDDANDDDGAGDDKGSSVEDDESEVDDGESGSDPDVEKEDPEGDGESPDEGKGTDDGEGEDPDDGDGAKKEGSDGGDEEGKSDEGADKPDHINDPIPEGTKESTAQRIQSLISDVKELSTARDERDAIMGAINEAQATPEQYAGALTVLRLYNSDTVEDKQKCLELIRSMERDLAFEVGETEGHVKLEDYPDLQAEVEAGNITEQYALELAGNRAREKHLSTKREAQQQQTSQEEQTKELVNQGRAALTELGNELMADPAYKALYPTFTAILRSTLRSVHPTEWKAVAQETFKQLKAANPNAGKAPNPDSGDGKKPARQPLRPKSGSSSAGKKSEADSALDAMNDALGGL